MQNSITHPWLRGFTLALVALLACAAPGLALAEDDDEDLPRPRLNDPTPTPRPGFAEGRAVPKTLSWSGGRQIVLLLPPAWDAKSERGPKGSLGIRIKPRAGRTFSFVIDAIPLTPAERIRLSGEGLRELVENDARRILPDAMENSARLERVLGDAGHGYLYSLTDKRPTLPSGEYRYMTAGAYLSGDLLFIPSIMHNDTSGAVKDQMLKVLKSVRPVRAD